MRTPQRTARPPQEAIRIPLWFAALLLFVAVWLGTHILRNVTDTLTAMTACPQDVSVPPAWPTRWVRDAAIP
jgi:hypothetical protein